MTMEKNGKLPISEEEYKDFLLGELSPSLKSKGVSSLEQLEEIVLAGEYEIIRT